MPDLATVLELPDEAAETLKVPPHSISAEQSVLGGLMIDNDAWDKTADILTEEDFYRRDHRMIFRAVDSLARRDKPFDAVTLSELLEQQAELSDAGGLSYLGALVRNTPSAANIRAYADIVREKSVQRQLIRVGTDIADAAFNPKGKDTGALLDQAESKVFEIAEQRNRGQNVFEPIKTVLAKAVDRIETLFQRDSPITGVSTGFTDLDRITAGLQPSDLVIVAGRPSMGKTSLAMNIAEHASIKGQLPVAIFSMEMPSEQLAMRMMSSLGRIDQHSVRTGQLADDEWPRLTSAINLLSDAKLYIDDTPALTPTELRARSRRLYREEGGLGIILIDYLQLMQGSAGADNRTSEISEISRSLKSLARELNVPVLAMSQLNRNLEQRPHPHKRPIMSDLRESGSIEQDADVVVFIYRDEVYNEESPDKGIAEIHIAKQRNGPTGIVRLTFLGRYTRFESYIEEARFDKDFA